MSQPDDFTKAAPSSTDLHEVGSTGLVQYGGEVREDFLRQLQGKRGYTTYREMSDNHPVIVAVLYSIEMLVRGVDWTVTPSAPNDQRAVDEGHDFLGDRLGRGQEPRPQTSHREDRLRNFPAHESSLHLLSNRNRGPDRY